MCALSTLVGAPKIVLYEHKTSDFCEVCHEAIDRIYGFGLGGRPRDEPFSGGGTHVWEVF
jgi:hypothetical protein